MVVSASLSIPDLRFECQPRVFSEMVASPHGRLFHWPRPVNSIRASQLSLLSIADVCSQLKSYWPRRGVFKISPVWCHWLSRARPKPKWAYINRRHREGHLAPREHGWTVGLVLRSAQQPSCRTSQSLLVKQEKLIKKKQKCYGIYSEALILNN
jgi:hypothetical protein